ncbi:MAG: nitrate reductase associated protein [Cyanobacteria bacterium J06600_6]
MDNIQPQSSKTESTKYFQFETDFVGSLQCIPMIVRMKLDNCGVKLKLVHWNQFDRSERQKLVDLPCTTAEESQVYRNWLQGLITAKTGQPAKELPVDPHPPWLNPNIIPDSVGAKAKTSNATLSLEHWSNLRPAQRFALIKLSRPSHENKNFIPALKEFGILPAS